MSLFLSEGMCLIVPESLTCTTLLVFLSPSNDSQHIKANKRIIIQATDAGKDTELNPMEESTPKHASKMIIIPKGTYSHATTIRCYDERATWNNRLAQPT